MHLVSIHARRERVDLTLPTEAGIRNWRTRDIDLDARMDKDFLRVIS